MRQLILAIVFSAASCQQGVIANQIEQASSHSVPPSIASDCSVNVSAELNAWIDTLPDGIAGEPTLVQFVQNGCYRIDTRLNVEERSHLTFDGNGATFRKVTDEPGFDGAQWFVRSSDGITFTDMTVEGTNTGPHRTSGAYTDYEFQNNWTCWGCTHLTLDGVTGLNAWGDFLSTTADHWTVGQPVPGNIIVKNSTFRKSGRMGVAVTLGENFVIEDNSFDEVAWSVLDLEVEASTWSVSNVDFIGNRIGKVYHYIVATGGGFSLDVSNVRIKHNVMTEIPDTGTSYAISAVGDDWEIINNRIMTRGYGIRAKGATNVVVRDNTIMARNYSALPLRIEDSGNVSVRDNFFLTANNLGHWLDYTYAGTNTDVEVCGNRLEVDTDLTLYSPPDVVLYNDPVGCP